MSTLLRLVAGWLVAPAGDAEPPVAAGAADRRDAERASSSSSLAVVAPPGEAHALAAALALHAARRGPVVVALWVGNRAPARAPRPGLVATRGARRLARGLAARELAVVAAGRLVTVVLPGDEREAAAAALRADAIAAPTPVVLAAGGPRGAAWDGLLAGRDVVVVAGTEPALAGLAVARLAEQGVAAVPLLRVPSRAAGALARAGLAAPGRPLLPEAGSA